MDKSKVQEMISKASSLELELVWIPRIMERQTHDEVMSESTREKNNVGLNGRDAPYITSLMNQINAGKHLSPKQVIAVKKILPKYAGQYLSIMAQQGGKVDTPHKKAKDNVLDEDYYGQDVQPRLTLKGEWCQCGNPSGNTNYMADNICPCGVGKHHYHCLDCGAITQVG